MAILLAVVATASVSAVALALAVMMAIESRAAAYVRGRQALMAAADAGVELALADLSSAGWTASLVDAPPSALEGTALPLLTGWGTLDVAARTRELQRRLDSRNRWGANGPRLFARGRGFLDELIGGARPEFEQTLAGRIYLMTWVADDPADGDDDPERDSNGVVDVRAEAYAAPASRLVVLASVRRHGHGIEVISWREPAD